MTEPTRDDPPAPPAERPQRDQLPRVNWQALEEFLRAHTKRVHDAAEAAAPLTPLVPTNA